MFTLDQIKEVHARVKSGKDFPFYIQELIQLGLTGYSTYVSDGHTEYSGKNNQRLKSEAGYMPLKVADTSDQTAFIQYLKIHQEGQTDYPRFCRDSALTGVEKWTVDMQEMTCTYFDKSGAALLVEKIPVP
jgi:uncharacterized protein YbcV (DUF1398 family)